MKVSDIMTARVVAMPADATVAEVAARMRDERVGSVIITEDGELVGIVTDRQITHTVVADGLDPNTVAVRDIMFTDFVPLEPDMDLLQAVRLQRELAMRRLPVVEDGVPVGIVSVSDIAAFTKELIDCVLVEGEVRVLAQGLSSSDRQLPTPTHDHAHHRRPQVSSAPRARPCSKSAERPASTSRRCATTRASSRTAPAACASSRSRACAATRPRARRWRPTAWSSPPTSEALHRAAHDRRRAAALGPQGRVPDLRVERRSADCRTSPTSSASRCRASRARSTSRDVDRRQPAHRARSAPSASRAAAACASATRCRAATSGATPSRGFDSVPNTPFGVSLLDAGCEFCGQCVSTCPTGALTDKPSRFRGRHWELTWTETTCGYCGVGCTIEFATKDGAHRGRTRAARQGAQLRQPVREGPLRLELRAASRPAHHAAHPPRRRVRRGDVGRGDRARRREARRRFATRTAATRSPGSPRRSARTRRTTCSRSSCGRASARTTSTTAPVFDTAPRWPVWPQRSGAGR